MKRRVFIWSLVLVLALSVPAWAQSQTPKKDELTEKDEHLGQVIFSKKPDPKRPENYQGPRVNATIVLRVIFTSSGKVTNIKVTKVLPEGIPEKLSKDLIKRCTNAAKKIRFTPATKDGHPVSMYMQLEYNFDLK